MSQFKRVRECLPSDRPQLYIPICLNLNPLLTDEEIGEVLLYIPICLNLNTSDIQAYALEEAPLHSNMSQFKLCFRIFARSPIRTLHSNMSQFKLATATGEAGSTYTFTFQYVSI